MAIFSSLGVVIFLLAIATDAQIGVNYGRVANNLPYPSRVVSLIKTLDINMVKIFDANSEVLTTFKYSGIKLAIMVTNQELYGVANDIYTAYNWVEKNVLPYYTSININCVIVANEILSDSSNKDAWSQLVPAMRNIKRALVANGLGHIWVTTAVAMDALSVSYPPSSGQFRSDIASTIMTPILQFLSESNSPFFANAYPYFAWATNIGKISIEYATFGSSAVVVQDGQYGYKNLFDAMVDSIYAAMERLGYYNVNIVISETGWPTQGGYGTNPQNAALYNQGLVNKILRQEGTPRRPYTLIPTYIFGLFNENEKSSTLEQHWGLLNYNGSKVYDIHI